MTDELPFDWNHPIPGNATAIHGEIDRLRALCERLGQGAQQLRELTAPGWHGPAADGFASFRARVAAQWDEAEEAHRRWAEALTRYRDVLITVQPLARDAIQRAKGDNDWVRARADIDRWREQVALAGARAAAVLQDVTGQLRSLPSLLAAPAVPAPAVSRRLSQVPAEPALHDQSPAWSHRQVISLCQAVLTAEYVSAEQL